MKDPRVIDFCKLPGTGKGYKWPKLSEALPRICNRKIVNAHNAMVDAIACRDIYFEMRKKV
jgi:DNA polymerase III epsilon subunit-like protein